MKNPVKNLIKYDWSLSLYKACLHFLHVLSNIILCLLNLEKKNNETCHGSPVERAKNFSLKPYAKFAMSHTEVVVSQ